MGELGKKNSSDWQKTAQILDYDVLCFSHTIMVVYRIFSPPSSSYVSLVCCYRNKWRTDDSSLYPRYII